MSRAFFLCALTAAALIAAQPVADANDTLEISAGEAAVESQPAQSRPSEELDPWSSLDGPEAEPQTRCSTNSDCPNSQCRNGQCGGCSTNSDCGYGQCRSGQCGACSTNSDCRGWGSCNGGQCGRCSTSSDCGSFGSCSSGRCERSPY